jgi:hypothetical protein
MTMQSRMFRFHDLSWEARTLIKKWMAAPRVLRDGFSAKNFDNPNLRVIQVNNSVGQTVAFGAVETAFMLSAYLLNPEATDQEYHFGGQEVDCEIAKWARMDGVRRMLYVTPQSHYSHQPDEKLIRIVEREFPQNLVMRGAEQSASVAVVS